MTSKGRVLITGAAKRLGREMALNLAANGYDLVISYNKSQKEAQELSNLISSEYKVDCDIFGCDLTNRKGAEDLVQFMSSYLDWNLLINNASIFNQSKFLDEGFKEMDDNFNIHLTSPIILSKAFAKSAPKNSNIINIVDKMVTRSQTSFFYYLLSKQYLTQLTKMLATQLSPNIRVNAIAPGTVLEDLSGEDTRLKNPLKVKGGPEYIIKSLNYLLENEFVTGQIIFADGGASLTN